MSTDTECTVDGENDDLFGVSGKEAEAKEEERDRSQSREPGQIG